MQKVCVVIPSHSPSFFTKMTVCSLIQQEPLLDLNIHVGIHSNLSDYTDDFSMFNELRQVCQFHIIDEIDWVLNNDNLMRYSEMHAKNLENLFKNVKYYDWDWLVVLDNDLLIKEGFITNLINRFPSGDLIGTLFNDRTHWEDVTTAHGDDISFAPKVSPWNLLMSRKLYNTIMTDSKVIYPVNYENLYFDTFAKVLDSCIYNHEWDFNVQIIPTEEMGKMVHHFFFSSFNYGFTNSHKDYQFALNEYNIHFPQGITEIVKNYLLPKV